MCGGGGGGGGGSPKPNPAVAVAPAVGSFNRGAAPQNAVEAEGTATAAYKRRQAQQGKNPFRVRLDVASANVGGSGATGLNIPQPRG